MILFKENLGNTNEIPLWLTWCWTVYIILFLWKSRSLPYFHWYLSFPKRIPNFEEQRIWFWLNIGDTTFCRGWFYFGFLKVTTNVQKYFALKNNLGIPNKIPKRFLTVWSFYEQTLWYSQRKNTNKIPKCHAHFFWAYLGIFGIGILLVLGR